MYVYIVSVILCFSLKIDIFIYKTVLLYIFTHTYMYLYVCVHIFVSVCVNITHLRISVWFSTFRMQIRAALNQQTAVQFQQYAEAQYPKNRQQVCIIEYLHTNNVYVWVYRYICT